MLGFDYPMKTKHIITLAILAFCSSSLPLFAVQIADIGLPGANSSGATSINELGQATGTSDDQPFLYANGVTVSIAGQFETGFTHPNCINNLQHIPGQYVHFPWAAVWRPSGNLWIYGQLGAEGLAINNLDQWVGYQTGRQPDGSPHAFLLRAQQLGH
jgi:hypothetical protein